MSSVASFGLQRKTLTQRGGEVGIIDSICILNGDSYTVISTSTLSKIVSLEVKGSLREAISNESF